MTRRPPVHKIALALGVTKYRPGDAIVRGVRAITKQLGETVASFLGGLIPKPALEARKRAKSAPRRKGGKTKPSCTSFRPFSSVIALWRYCFGPRMMLQPQLGRSIPDFPEAHLPDICLAVSGGGPGPGAGAQEARRSGDTRGRSRRPARSTRRRRSPNIPRTCRRSNRRLRRGRSRRRRDRSGRRRRFGTLGGAW